MTTELHMDFDKDSLGLVQIPITFNGKRYWLVEAFGDAVAEYRNALMSGAKINTNADGKPKTMSMGSMADAALILVSKCLFGAADDGTIRTDAFNNVDIRYRVPLSTVRVWPNRVLEPLFDKVKQISGIDEADSVETLEKKIAELTRRLTVLKKSKETHEQELLAKNSLPAGISG
jgi:hypothetical protein